MTCSDPLDQVTVIIIYKNYTLLNIFSRIKRNTDTLNLNIFFNFQLLTWFKKEYENAFMWNHTRISHLYSIVVYGWIWKCQLEKKNYIFFLIEECNDGTYGKNCNNTCGHCDPPCDKITGKCPHGCKPGYEGVFCNKSKTQSILYYFFYQFSS